MSFLTRRSLIAAGASLGSLTLVTKLFAQEAETEEAPGGANDPAAGMDPAMAMELLITGKKQIALCTAALGKLTNEKTRNFAQIEIDEHKEVKKALNGLGFEMNVTDLRGNPLVNEPISDRPTRVVFSANGGPLPAASLGSLLLCYETAEQCIATAAAEMAQVKPNDIDRRFIECQLDAHYGIYDHGVTFHKHAGPQLQAVLEKAKPIIEQHIAMCKEIRMSLT